MMGKKRIPGNALLIMLLALFVPVVLGQEVETPEAEEDEEAITVAVKLGFGVWFKPDKWAPAELIVENIEEPLEGTISIESVPVAAVSSAR